MFSMLGGGEKTLAKRRMVLLFSQSQFSDPPVCPISILSHMVGVFTTFTCCCSHATFCEDISKGRKRIQYLHTYSWQSLSGVIVINNVFVKLLCNEKFIHNSFVQSLIFQFLLLSFIILSFFSVPSINILRYFFHPRKCLLAFVLRKLIHYNNVDFLTPSLRKRVCNAFTLRKFIHKS